MEAQKQAPLSHQQAELIATIRAHPYVAERYDGLALYRLGGAVRADCLTAALGDLAVRHPALRTILDRCGDELVQLVRPAQAAVIPDTVAVPGTVDGLIGELVSRHYKLADIVGGRPLFRPALLSCGQELLLSLAISHLIYDGWSLRLIRRDLAECYQARLEGRAPRLPGLLATYAGYSQAQRDALRRDLPGALAFYRETVGGHGGRVRWPAPAACEGEPGKPAGSAEPGEIGRVRLSVPDSSVMADILRAERVTRFVVLLCATAAAICSVCGQPDVIAGVDTANRDDPRFRDVVGFFLNTRMVRIRVAGQRRLADLVRSVRGPWLAAAQHDSVYRDQVLRALGDPEVVAIGLAIQSSGQEQRPELDLYDATALTVPLPGSTHHWRALNIGWDIDQTGYHATLEYRLSAVDGTAVRQIADVIRSVLDSGVITGTG